MLGNTHFYNRTIRKIVVAFGTLFNNIQLVRYNKAGTTAYEKFKVPLSYGSKERYLTRITSDPNFTRSVNAVVPRIAFELTGMSYDSSRIQTTLTQNFAQSPTGVFKTQYAPVPYDFNFSMSIFVRNTEDGTQIVEQIIPYFRPDYTVTVDFIPDMDQKYDLPIILTSVNTVTDYEGALVDGTTRLITWDLEFTVKGYIWPAVKSPTGGLIGAEYANTAAPGNTSFGRVITNLWIDTQDRQSQQVTVDYANGNNYFTTGETIRVEDREVTGKVVYFSNSNNGVLIVSDLNELLNVGDKVKGDYTNANYTITRLQKGPAKVISISTQADPINSEPDDEFGFSETITEWPDTL
jgi:hypothetical protein